MDFTDFEVVKSNDEYKKELIERIINKTTFQNFNENWLHRKSIIELQKICKQLEKENT